MIEKICEDIFLCPNYNTIATIPIRVIFCNEEKMLNPCKINDSLITISQFFRRKKKNSRSHMLSNIRLGYIMWSYSHNTPESNLMQGMRCYVKILMEWKVKTLGSRATRDNLRDHVETNYFLYYLINLHIYYLY